VLPRELVGTSTFGLAMKLLKWFPVRVVDKILVVLAKITIGDTEKYGISRPKTGPLELKNNTGRSPVLDVGALSLIKKGKIKVESLLFFHTLPFSSQVFGYFHLIISHFCFSFD